MWMFCIWVKGAATGSDGVRKKERGGEEGRRSKGTRGVDTQW